MKLKLPQGTLMLTRTQWNGTPLWLRKGGSIDGPPPVYTEEELVGGASTGPYPQPHESAFFLQDEDLPMGNKWNTCALLYTLRTNM